MGDHTKGDVLAEQLRQRMREGEFGTNGRLPPHHVLAKQKTEERSEHRAAR
jgi:DNA-binding GntR family transcriptional regulator